MEDNYFFIDDCIVNLEIAQYHIYFAMLMVTKKFFSNFYNISKLNVQISTDIENEKRIFKLHLFRNLTYLNTCRTKNYYSCTREYINYQLYIDLYFQKFHQYPILCTLESNYIIHGNNKIILTNLKNIGQYESAIESTRLNKHFELTSLIFKIPQSQTLNDYKTLNHLKILQINEHHHNDKFVNYTSLNCLEKLTLNMNHSMSNKPMNINYSKLTCLCIKYENALNVNSLHIDLNIKMKLKYLELSNVSCYGLEHYLKVFQETKINALKQLKLNNTYSIELNKLFNDT